MNKGQKILATKKQTPLTVLCQNAPVQLQEILLIATHLGFSEKPSYGEIKKILRKMITPKLSNCALDWIKNKSVRSAFGMKSEVSVMETEFKS